jgi:uncharacterized protein with WD repeat
MSSSKQTNKTSNTNATTTSSDQQQQQPPPPPPIFDVPSISTQQLLIRGHSQGIGLYKITKSSSGLDDPYKCSMELLKQQQRKKGVKRSVFSMDGHILMMQNDIGDVEIINTSTNEINVIIPGLNIAYADLSPLGNFITAWIKPDILLVLNSSSTNNKLLTLTSKKQNSTLQWTQDEHFAAMLEPSGAISFYSNNNNNNNNSTFTEITPKIKLDPPCTQFSISNFSLPDKDDENKRIVLFAVFQPGKSGKPATVSLHSFPGGHRISFASTFRADEASFRWSPTGLAVLCKVESAVDATGQSYYGESKLFLLLESPTVKGGEISVNIIPPKEGTIYDYQWSPKSDSFCVCAGKSPARCTL